MVSGKRNREIKKIENIAARSVCFSKRRNGLFRKAQQYSQLSGSHAAVLVFSAAGRPYTHASPSSFDSIVDFYFQQKESSQVVGPMIDTDTITESSVSSEVGLKEEVEGLNVEGCNILEELLEMERKLEELREKVLYKWADSPLA